MKYNNLFDPANTVLDQINKSSYDATVIAIQKHNTSFLEDMLGYHVKILYYCTENLAADVLHIKLNELLRLYADLHSKSRNNVKTEEIKDYYCSRLTSILPGIINRIGYKYNTEDNEPKNQKLNELYYQCFYSFSRLLFSLMVNSDWENFKGTFSSLSNSDPSQRLNYHYLEQELFDLMPKTEHEKEEIISFNAVKKMPITYWLNARLGILYWSMFLYEKSVLMPDKVTPLIDEKTLKEILSLYDAHSFHSGISSSIDNLILAIQQDGFFGLDMWDYQKRESGQAWFSRGMSYWYTRGFVIDLIRSNNDLMLRTIIDFANQIDLLKTLISEISTIENDSSVWEKVLEMSNEQIRERTTELTRQLSDMIRKVSVNSYHVIAEAELDLNRIEEIQTETYNIWDRRSLINNLFKWYKCRTNILPKPENPLPISYGNRFFYRGLREQLVDENPRGFPRFGFNEFGDVLPRYDEQLFYNECLKYQERMRISDSIIRALDDGMKEILVNHQPTIIIMHRGLFDDKDLNDSPDFIPHWQIQEKITEEVRFSLYRDIKLFITEESVMINKIFIGSLAEAFEVNKMEDYYDGTVSLDFTSIDKSEAEKVYNKNTDKWNLDDNGIKITWEDSIYKIMCSMYVDLWLHHSYKLIDKTAFVVFELPIH